MAAVIVIPARYQSSRFAGKPLVGLRGASGVEKTLIRRTWEAAQQVPDIKRVIVATEDQRIAEHASGFGAEVMMTSANARNGTERCAEVAASLDDDIEIVVNFQGDAPLTPPAFVTALIGAMQGQAMATPVLRCDAQTLDRFRADRAAGQVGGTLAVFDTRHRALYFSKEIIPFADHLPEPGLAFHHVGLYAYRRAALAQYQAWPEGRLEAIEGLEQLRFLENGVDVRCVEVDPEGRDFWEVNNPHDIARVEQALQKAGIA